MNAITSLSENIGTQLRAHDLTISCAESCTGGLLTSTLTDIAGSSAYVVGSVVSYSNNVKSRILHVSDQTLAVYGAVSEETAREMAEGIRRLIQTDIGVGITGIAGPDGGSEEKPVGLVYIAIANHQHAIVQGNYFNGTRMEIKAAAVQTALSMIEHFIRSTH